MIHYEAGGMPDGWRADAWEALGVFAGAERHQVGTEVARLGNDDLFRSTAFEPCLDGCYLRSGVVGGGLSLGERGVARRFLRLAKFALPFG